MPTAQEAAITNAHVVSSEIGYWLGPKRGEFDEAAVIGGAWLPIGQPGWSERSDTITGGGATAMQGRGYTSTFTVQRESRLAWGDDLAVAVVCRFYLQGAYTGWQLVAFGYLDGSGRQERGIALDATGERTAVLVDYWEKSEAESHQFGARNLADGATVVGSTTPLANPAGEAPYEYLSQDTADGGNAVDQDSDTVAVSSLIADAAPPGGVGATVDPKFVILYAGRTARSIGAGGEPLAIGIAMGYDMLGGWGSFASAAAVPNHSESDTNQPNNQYVVGTVAGDRYVLQVKAQPGNPDAKNYVQWNVGGADNVPIRIEFEIKAGSTGSIGRFAMVQLGPFDGGTKDYHIPLSNAWAKYEMSFDSSGVRGCLLRFRAGRLELAAQDLYIEIRNLRVYAGYCDESPDHDRLFLAYDNGAGEERWCRLAFDLTSSAFTMAPHEILWLVDDAAVFRAKFDPGDATVIALKNLYPNFYFNPGVGKLKLAYNTNPLRNAYGGGTDPYSGGGVLLDEAILSGFVFGNDEMAMRVNPAITGNWATIAYAQASIRTDSAFGASWWQIKLPPYVPPKMVNAVAAGATRIAIDDSDQVVASGVVYIGPSGGPWDLRQINYLDGDTLVLTAGVSQGWPAGTPVYPQWQGDRQTAHLISGVEVRRKEGKTRIADGKVLYSLLDNPTAPSPDFERGTDWDLYASFSEAWGWRATLTPYPNQPTQAAQIAAVVSRMERRAGEAERAKINEIIVREYKRGASQAGGYRSHAGSNAAHIIGHYLTQHGGVPEAKVVVVSQAAPTGDVRIPNGPILNVVQQFERNAALAVYTDPYGTVYIAPDPASPVYTATSIAFGFDHTNIVGGVAVTYAAAHEISQVRGTFRDPESFRTYVAAYPPNPARLGQAVEIRDGIARSATEALAACEARFRAGLARRVFRFKTGPAPWLRKYMRVLLSLADLDADGQQIGVNCYVESFVHDFPIDDGGVDFTTSVVLKELAL